ncbi:MAG: GAF domain-containing protein, partial [Chloroflexi bacterium]
MAFIPAVALIVFFIISPHIELYLTNSVVVFSGLGLFMLAGLLAEDVEQDATIAYLNFSAIVTWLALGVAPALTVIIVGVALTAVLRQTLASSLNLRERTFIEIRNLALRRVAATGNAILLAAGGYALLDGMMPLKTLDADDVTALIVALPIAFVSIKLVEFFLPLEDTRTPSLWDWSHQQRGRLVVEIFLLPTSVALSLVVHNAPPGVFAVIMILLGLQALRQNQVSQSQQLLHQRVQELSLLTTLGQRLSRSLLLEDLIQSLHIQITTIMPSSATVLVVYDVRAELPDYHAMFGQTNAKWTGKKAVVGPVLRTVRQRTLQYVKPVVPEELQAEGFDLSHFKGELTFIGVPLLVEDGAAIGAIGVIIDERRPDVRPEQLEWLQGISAQTANAVQNAINYAQTTLLAEHLALINRTVQSVLFNLDREDAIDIACKSIQQIANTQKVAVSTIDVEEQRLALEKVVGLTPAHRALIEQRSLEYAVATTTTRVIHNIGDVKDEPALLEQARIGAFQACVIIPLQSGDMVVGLVEVYHDDPQHYTPTIINLLETLASLIAAMLDNTRLFQALETYAFEMTQLANLSRTATSTLQLDLVVDDIAQVFGQLINVNRVVVARLMPNNQRFKLFGIANNDVTSDGEANQVGDSYLPDLPELRVFLQDSFPELLIFHSSDQNCSAALRAFMDENQERSLAFVPIIIEQTVLGVVLLGTHEERRFMPREWHLIEAATNQIAAHVHNTLLFERTQRDLDQRLEELSLIENIARQISGELNVSQIITNVLDAAMRSTGADMAGLAMLTEANEFLVISRRT